MMIAGEKFKHCLGFVMILLYSYVIRSCCAPMENLVKVSYCTWKEIQTPYQVYLLLPALSFSSAPSPLGSLALAALPLNRQVHSCLRLHTCSHLCLWSSSSRTSMSISGFRSLSATQKGLYHSPISLVTFSITLFASIMQSPLPH